MLRGAGAFKHRKSDENLNLTNETPVYTGSFNPSHGWTQVKFGKSIKTRYFCLEALNSHGGDDYASIAELELLGEDDKSISRQHWKVVYANSEEIENANNAANNVFDLQESTIWHTGHFTKDRYPHHIVIDLGEDKIITGFSYLPRGDANKAGMIKDYRIYLKETPFKL
jgi:beta-galactosidase